MKKCFVLILTLSIFFSCGGSGSSSPGDEEGSPGSPGSGGAAQGYQVQEKIQAVDQENDNEIY